MSELEKELLLGSEKVIHAFMGCEKRHNSLQDVRGTSITNKSKHLLPNMLYLRRRRRGRLCIARQRLVVAQ